MAVPVVDDLDLVPHCSQLLGDRLARLALDLELFAADPLDARRVERLRGVHGVIDGARQHLDLPCGCMNAPITPNGPTASPSLSRKPGMIVW